MAKSIKKILKSFTLIELIIVIAIIAVLGATAFLLLTQWMSKSRDAQRISDLATIKTALDIALTKNDQLPLPDEAKELLYTGTEILYQGVFGDQVVKSIGTLNKVPKDRQSGEYEYSLLYDKKSYRIKAVMENEQYQLAFLNQAKASDEVYRYVGKDIKAVTVNGMFVYLPSMFITGYNEEGKYDLYGTDMDVFVGNKIGEYKSGFALPVDQIDQIKSKLEQLGIEQSQANQIVAQGTGQPQIVLEESCDGNLPANSVLNGTVKSGVSWNYGDIAGECVYKCKDYYKYTDGECLSNLGNYTLALSTNWEQSGTVIIDNKLQLGLTGNYILDKSIAVNGNYQGEYFEMDGNKYLALANYYNGSSYSVNSVIYKWDGSQFVSFQTIATVGARQFEYFEIDGNKYLALVSYTGTNTIIYKWNGTIFVSNETIPTSGGFSAKYFNIAGTHYLMIVRYYASSVFNLTSTLYKWDGTKFVSFQGISTVGGLDPDYYDYNGIKLLSIINHKNSSTYALQANIYSRNGTQFDLIQSISTVGGRGGKFFQIGGDLYYALSNYTNGSAYTYSPKLYKRNGSQFIESQAFDDTGVTDIIFYTFGGEYYMFFSRHYNGSLYTLNSPIYKWNGSSFTKFKTIATIGSLKATEFVIDNIHYIFSSSYYNDGDYTINSQLYKYSSSYITNNYQIGKNNSAQSIDLSNTKKITKININQSQPTGTNVKYLVSFDGGVSYKTKINGTWEVANASEIATKGMSDLQLKSALEGYLVTTELTLDFVIGLNTNNPAVTSSFSSIDLEYEKK